ncbi:MAG TPA: amidohydrolase family protein [Stellaceae bacterium]|jgi:predicted TIM-barrel fold metal-dependent hydrolase|nr:amidohydrolase family protein [Stellaceae bacterium]
MSDYLHSKAPSKIIAVEEHFVTPLYRQHVAAGEFRKFFISSRSEQLGYDIPKELLDLGETRLRYMDESGIDVQLLSFGQPGAQGFGAEIAIPMARDANERLYEAMRKHPDRFAGFAALPTADPDTSARELERCVKEFGFKGAMIHGHTQGAFLDEKKFWGIFETAEKLDVPIYLHPAMPHPDAIKAYFAGYEELQGSAWGFALDTSCHFLRIMFAGVFDAYPKLKIVLGHLGEGLPFAMHRLQDHTYRSAKRRGLKKTALDYIKDNLVVTTSGNWYEPAFVCTLLALGIDNILFAVDWPYEPNRVAKDFLQNLSISDEDKEKLARLNSERLFKM